MSFHLQTTNRPKLNVESCQAPTNYKEIKYKLWIDIHELVNCEERLFASHSGDVCVTVQAFIQGYKSDRVKAQKNS